MLAIRALACALAGAALLGAGGVKAAATTNFTDQWWILDESGWGAAVMQQADTLFVDLFVYAADGAPTWFTAAAFLQSGSGASRAVFTGDLYATRGPYYGATWDAATVSRRKVGTLTFDASSGTDATITYTVDGVQVAKAVTRQFWRSENLGGSYYGGWNGQRTSCTTASEDGPFEAPIALQITHNADDSVILDIEESGTKRYTLAGTYTQLGHMGKIVASFGPPGPPTGSVTFFDIERTTSGLTARFASVRPGSAGTCVIANGRLTGIRR